MKQNSEILKSINEISLILKQEKPEKPLKKWYKKCVKEYHPDNSRNEDKKAAGLHLILINKLYSEIVLNLQNGEDINLRELLLNQGVKTRPVQRKSSPHRNKNHEARDLMKEAASYMDEAYKLLFRQTYTGNNQLSQNLEICKKLYNAQLLYHKILREYEDTHWYPGVQDKIYHVEMMTLRLTKRLSEDNSTTALKTV